MKESQDVNSFGGGEYGDVSENEGYIRGGSSVLWKWNYLTEHHKLSTLS